MLKTIEDNEKVINLTGISDGTLLTCLKQTNAFGHGDILRNYIHMQNIRLLWKDFTYSTLQNHYENWIDCWNAFLIHFSTSTGQSNTPGIKHSPIF
jgi:hypothetical protein